jgi:hypothetical protein
MDDVIAAGNNLAKLLGQSTGSDTAGPSEAAPSRRFMSAAEQMAIGEGFVEGLDDIAARAYPRARAAISDIPATVDGLFAKVKKLSPIRLRVFNVEWNNGLLFSPTFYRYGFLSFCVDAVDKTGNLIALNVDAFKISSPIFTTTNTIDRHSDNVTLENEWEFKQVKLLQMNNFTVKVTASLIVYSDGTPIWPAGVKIVYKFLGQKSQVTIPNLNILDWNENCKRQFSHRLWGSSPRASHHIPELPFDVSVLDVSCESPIVQKFLGKLPGPTVYVVE